MSSKNGKYIKLFSEKTNAKAFDKIAEKFI